MYSRRKLLKEFESWFKAAFIGEPSKDHPHSSEMNEYKVQFIILIIITGYVEVLQESWNIVHYFMSFSTV